MSALGTAFSGVEGKDLQIAVLGGAFSGVEY